MAPPKTLPPLPNAVAWAQSSPSASMEEGGMVAEMRRPSSMEEGRLIADVQRPPSSSMEADGLVAEEVAEYILPTEQPIVEMQAAIAGRPRSQRQHSAAGGVQKHGVERGGHPGGTGGYRRGIDSESLVLNLTPAGLVEHLLCGEEGIDAADRWGWTALHKSAIYGKSDHIIALLDAGADPSVRTQHDPTQIYKPQANALELAQCVDHEGWGDRIPIIQMLETALSGAWQATRSEEERQKLKHQENIRLRQEQLERDLQMVAKGEALMRMKQRQEMEENLSAMAEAERRRDEAVEREARAEQLLADAEEARDAAQIKQADAEASQFALQARLSASRKEGEHLGARIAELERALASALEESRALREEMQERARQWEVQTEKTAANHAAQLEAVHADLQSAQSVAEDLKEQLATRVRLHRLAVERAETAENKIPPLVARAEAADAKIATQAEEIACLIARQTTLESELTETKLALAQEQSAKDDALNNLVIERAAHEEQQQKLVDTIALHKAEVTELESQLGDSRAETHKCEQKIETLTTKLASAQDLLEEERKNLARSLREFAEQMKQLNAEHAARVTVLESEVERQKKETEAISQQLVGKIRQLKTERARADAAESKIPPLKDEIGRLEVLRTSLEASVAQVEAALAAEEAAARALRDELVAEQAAKAGVISQLESETAARREEELKVVSLQNELQETRNVIVQLNQEKASLDASLAATNELLSSERIIMAGKEAEWESIKADLHTQLQAVHAELEQQKIEMESISQQLVGKIRQYKAERARAELAESQIPPLVEEVSVLKVVNGKLQVSLTLTKTSLAEEKAVIRQLWADLHKEQTNKDFLSDKLAAEKFARAVAEKRLRELRVEIDARQAELKSALDETSRLQAELSSTEQSLEDQIKLLVHKEAEWAENQRILTANHQVQIGVLESEVERQKKETEAISQQLVGKIRQLKTERARADAAESKIPPLKDEIGRLEVLRTSLEASVAQVEAALAAEEAAARALRDELVAEQAAKAGVISQLESETAARREEELKVVSLQNELQETRNVIAELEGRLGDLTQELSATKKAFAAEKELSERQLADLRNSMARLVEEHTATVVDLQDQVAHEKEDKETVSMQLVAKIRQLRSERERADTAEAKILTLDEQLTTMSALYETASAELEAATTELAATKLRVAKLSLALDEERRTSSELRVTNLATEQRAERAEACVEELRSHVALVEGELADVRATIPPLEARIAALQTELDALREEYAQFREEAAKLQQQLREQLQERESELLDARSILETKDDQGRTLLERLAASEERERMDAMRINLLNKQYSAMVATFSDKDLLSTATPPASPLESPSRTPRR